MFISKAEKKFFFSLNTYIFLVHSLSITTASCLSVIIIVIIVLFCIEQGGKNEASSPLL